MTEAKRFVGQVEPRLKGHRTHMCCACDFPISVYGRCAPCLHAYCLTCAAGMAHCIICRAAITKLERIPASQGLFISPLTLQGFRTEADLARHAQQLDAHLQQLLAATTAAAAVSGGMGGAGGPMQGLSVGAGGPMPPSAHHAARQMQQQQQQQAAAGWKPPPPPLPPGAAAGGTGGFGMQQQQQAAGGRGQPRPPRQGTGAIMRPR